MQTMRMAFWKVHCTRGVEEGGVEIQAMQKWNFPSNNNNKKKTAQDCCWRFFLGGVVFHRSNLAVLLLPMNWSEKQK